MNILYYFLLIFTTQANTETQLKYFITEDTNDDGVLTKYQFIKALTNLFKFEVIDTKGYRTK